MEEMKKIDEVHKAYEICKEVFLWFCMGDMVIFYSCIGKNVYTPLSYLQTVFKKY